MTAHFGSWVQNLASNKPEWQVSASLVYGQLIKFCRRRKLAHVERVMRWGKLNALQTSLQAAGWNGILQTAFVERVNREIVRRTRVISIFPKRGRVLTPDHRRPDGNG